MKLADKLNSYQEGAVTTKIYDEAIGIPYVILGVIGEVGEFLDTLPHPANRVPNADQERLASEAGDVMWYLAATCSEMGKKMGDVFIVDISLGQGVDVVKTLTNLAELTKKFLRDEWPAPMSNERWDKIKRLLNIVFNFIVIQIGNWELPHLYQILDDNYDKLQSRKDRGVLSGSGDNR